MDDDCKLITPPTRNSKEKQAKLVQDINEQIEEKETEVQEQALKLEQIRATLGEIEREINEAAVTMSSLRQSPVAYISDPVVRAKVDEYCASPHGQKNHMSV